MDYTQIAPIKIGNLHRTVKHPEATDAVDPNPSLGYIGELSSASY